jgi:kinesin family protein 2/24
MSESENGSDFGASQTSLFFKKMEKKKEPKPRNGRKTEVQTQSNKGRYESKLQNPAISGRAGSKGLSTIPSEEAAIMSPLVKLTSSQLEETALPGSVTRDKKNRTRASTGSQSSLMSKSFDSAVISGSDSDSRPSSRRSIQPPSASGRRDQASVQSSVSSAASGRSGVSSLTKEKMDRSKSPQMVRASPKSGIAQPTARRNNRERSRSRSPVRQSPSRDRFLRGNTKSFDDRSDTGASTDQMSSKVFVHGMPDDTSWNAQVSRLREASEAEHSEQLYNEGHVVDEEEMRIRVIVRKRPMSKREASTSDAVDVIHPLTYNNYGRVLVYQPKTRVDLTKEIETLPFAFDNVFDELSSNLDIYDSTVRNLIPGVFDGKWASVFAYGQTGSGKTFTMMGSGLTGKKAGNQRDNDSENFGLYYLAAQDLFKQANQRRNQHISVGASLFEIYGGKLFDLLNNRHPIKCLEDQKGKVCFPGLSEHPVSDADELMSVIEQGALNRSTGTTSANADSSRSHAVLQLSLRKQVGRQSNVEHGKLMVETHCSLFNHCSTLYTFFM